MVQNRVNSAARNIGNSTTAGRAYHDKRIQAGLSTQIVIQVTDGATSDKFVIGAVQSLQVTETRTITAMQEVGTDGIIQLVPTAATTYSLDVTRMIFDFQRLPDALQREYRHIHAQRRPFDIVVTDYNPYLQNPDGPKTPDSGSEVETFTSDFPAIQTTYGNCWFTSMNFTYTANEYLITESCNLVCEFVRDVDGPAIIKPNADALEREAGTSQAASIMSAFDADLPV